MSIRRSVGAMTVALCVAIGGGVRATTSQSTAVAANPTAQAPPAASGGTTTVKLFFVALEDGGKSGPAVGCGDSLVSVQRVMPRSVTPLAATIRDLLSIRESRWGQSGLYNALAASQLDLVKATIADGVADIRLAGALTVGGTCDGPRIEAQLREAARQFAAVKSVNVYVNDVPLATVLSARGR